MALAGPCACWCARGEPARGQRHATTRGQGFKIVPFPADDFLTRRRVPQSFRKMFSPPLCGTQDPIFPGPTNPGKCPMFCHMIIVWVPGMGPGEIWVPQGATTCSGSVTNSPQQIPHVGVPKPCLWVGQAAEGGRDVATSLLLRGRGLLRLGRLRRRGLLRHRGRGGEGEAGRRICCRRRPASIICRAAAALLHAAARASRAGALGPTVPHRCKNDSRGRQRGCAREPLPA